jgi:hypothetical protein
VCDLTVCTNRRLTLKLTSRAKPRWLPACVAWSQFALACVVSPPKLLEKWHLLSALRGHGLAGCRRHAAGFVIQREEPFLAASDLPGYDADNPYAASPLDDSIYDGALSCCCCCRPTLQDGHCCLATRLLLSGGCCLTLARQRPHLAGDDRRCPAMTGLCLLLCACSCVCRPLWRVLHNGGV